MRIRIAMGFCAILAFMGIAFSTHTFAQAEKLQATIFLIGVQQPIVVQDFAINNQLFYDAVREGKPVKLPFRDLKEIRFLNPGSDFETEILFNDGKREKYSLKPASDIALNTEFSAVTMSHSKVARIEFSPVPVQPPQPAIQPVLQPPRPGGAQTGAFDRVFLKSGDILSGNIQTTTFPVRTAYGVFPLEMAKIASIDFDEKESNKAVVVLRNGDRLSGTAEADPILFVMTTGQGISFDGKSIKSIQFKR